MRKKVVLVIAGLAVLAIIVGIVAILSRKSEIQPLDVKAYAKPCVVDGEILEDCVDVTLMPEGGIPPYHYYPAQHFEVDLSDVEGDVHTIPVKVSNSLSEEAVYEWSSVIEFSRSGEAANWWPVVIDNKE